VRFWVATTGRERACVAWGMRNVQCVAFAPDGMTAAAGGSPRISSWFGMSMREPDGIDCQGKFLLTPARARGRMNVLGLQRHRLAARPPGTKNGSAD